MGLESFPIGAILAAEPSCRFDDASLNAAVPTCAVSAVHAVRTDLAAMRSPVRTTEGFLRAEGVITKAGIFPQPFKGKMVRELRPASEVLAPAALESFALVPITMGHPVALLTPKTARALTVGTVGTPVARGDTATAPLLVTDAVAIAAIEAGTTGLSCGYASLVWPVSGEITNPDGTVSRFDTVQTAIRGNHVAICSLSNVGPEAAIKMDEAFASRTVPAAVGVKTMKLKIGDVEVELDDKVGAALLAERADSVRAVAERDALAGKLAVSASAQVSAAQIAADEAKLADRLALVVRCAPVLDKPATELIRMDSAALMRAVLAVKSPEVSLDNRSSDFVAGAFEHVMCQRNDSASQLRGAIGQAAVQGAQKQVSEPCPIEAARARMLASYATGSLTVAKGAA